MQTFLYPGKDSNRQRTKETVTWGQLECREWEEKEPKIGRDGHFCSPCTCV